MSNMRNVYYEIQNINPTAVIIKKEWYNRENATMEANVLIYKSQNSFSKSMYFEHAKRNF